MTGARRSLGRNLLFGSLPVGAALFGLTYLVSRSVVAAGVVGTGIVGASLVSNIRFFRDVRRRGASQNEAAVEVTDVEASRVFDVEPPGTQGPALVFFVDDGRALLLVGHWLLEYRSFPSMAFRLHRWADTNAPIRIETAGPRIGPEQSTVRLRPSYRMRDAELFHARPDTLQEDLDRAFDTTASDRGRVGLER
jgi:hypothetical protein